MRKTSRRLADGREIIYFDERDDADRDTVDRRQLPPRNAFAEVRYDATTDEWVAVATHRQDRTHLPPSDDCPLCPAADGRLTEIPASDYDVVVFQNRFPSFSAEGSETFPRRLEIVYGDVLARRAAVGRCEVVCFTSDHHGSFARLEPTRVRTIIEAWVDRTEELSAIPGVRQVFCFENRGEEVGVTLHHPHGQIYAYPFMTPRTRSMVDAARRHRERLGRDLFSDLLEAERSAGERVIAEGEHWTAFVPSAARWPFEVHLYPHRRVPDIPALDDHERDELATFYPGVLRRFDGVFGLPMPYVAAWYQAPAGAGRELAYLHLRVFSPRRAPGKLKHLAGSEAGMGAFINDVLPEEAAQMLRKVDVA